jgi:hypothetical protein
MNHSIYSADRSTHLKIVVVALIAGIAVAGFGIFARSSSDDGYTSGRSASSMSWPCRVPPRLPG